MRTRSEALAASIAVAFLVAAGDAGAFTTLGASVPLQAPLGALDRLTELVRGLDQFLEAVLDLVRTLGRLFGEGGD